MSRFIAQHQVLVIIVVVLGAVCLIELIISHYENKPKDRSYYDHWK